MTRDEWDAINRARQCLGLGEQATLAEIKSAFRRLSKAHHPDLQGHGGRAAPEQNRLMRELTAAYKLLLEYCAAYCFPLVPGDNEPLEGDDWWMDRFGDDPLWGPGRKKED